MFIGIRLNLPVLSQICFGENNYENLDAIALFALPT